MKNTLISLCSVLLITCPGVCEDLPVKLMPHQETERIIEKWNKINGAGIDGIYPIGWSSGGKFAFIKESCGEGGCGYSISVLDLIKDKEVWNVRKFFDTPCTSDQTTNIYFSCFWDEANKSVYLDQIKNHGIQINFERYDLLNFPLQTNRDNIRISLREKPNSKHLYQIYMASKLRGEKVLSEYQSDGENLEVLGYLKSPFEERIAVFLAKFEPEWEGAFHGEVIIIGASLSEGFPK